jgi:hypothetical protein
VEDWASCSWVIPNGAARVPEKRHVLDPIARRPPSRARRSMPRLILAALLTASDFAPGVALAPFTPKLNGVALPILRIAKPTRNERRVECAPDGGQDHAAFLTVCRA